MLQHTIDLYTPLAVTECVQRLNAKTAPPDDWLATTRLVGQVSAEGFRLTHRRELVFFWLNPVFIGTFQFTPIHTIIHIRITIPFHEKLLVVCFPVLLLILALLLSSTIPLHIVFVMATLTCLFYRVFCSIRDAMLDELRDIWVINDRYDND